MCNEKKILDLEQVNIGVRLDSGILVLWSDGLTYKERPIEREGKFDVYIVQGDKGYHLLLDVKLQDCNSSVFIPNVFTPNHDGVNDVFQPIMQNAELINCQIYNRWGSCIYQSAHEMIWDGSYRGRNLDPGVYTVSYTHLTLPTKRIV